MQDIRSKLKHRGGYRDFRKLEVGGKIESIKALFWLTLIAVWDAFSQIRDYPRKRLFRSYCVASGLILAALNVALFSGSVSSTSPVSSKGLDKATVNPNRLVIYGPASVPAAVPPGEAATPVVFRVFVGGIATPPAVLFLHEVDDAGQLKYPPVAELRDNGKDGDTRPGDFTYAGTLDISSPNETSTNYRVQVKHFGETILSSITYLFRVTELPIGIRPSNPTNLVKDPKSNFRLYSNEVVVGIRHGARVDTARIEEIAGSVDGTVAGFWPPLNLYLLEIPGDGTAAGMRQAIGIIAVFSEVAYAEPNHETLPAAFPFDPPNENAVPLGAVPVCIPPSPCQWYLGTIGAAEAWQNAGGGSGMEVAILERGLDASLPPPDPGPDFAHADLSGQEVPGISTSTNLSTHATQVAGLIAAIANNNTGIAGVAWGSKLRPYYANGGSQIAATISAAVADGARIINLSQQSGVSAAVTVALGNAITSDALVVFAAGNQCNIGGCQDNVGTAQNNANMSITGGLLVVGATDQDDNFALWPDPSCEMCSSRGPSTSPAIDLYAPGTNIYSTTLTNGYQAAPGGTSFATALTSGAAAVLKAANPALTAEDIHDRLITTATALPTTFFGSPCRDEDGAITTTCRRLDLHAAADFNVPYDVVFALDRSGSMGGSTNITSPATSRWNALVQGVNAFTGIIWSTAPLGSRFGLTLFDTMPLPNPLASSLVNIISGSVPGSVSGALSQVPSGWTAMGPGLMDSIGKLTVVSRPRVVVLFTDGEQNRPPEVHMGGCRFEDDPSTPADESTIQINSGNCPSDPTTTGTIKIITVGVGLPSGMYQTTLQNLATNNRGHYIVTSNGVDVEFTDGTPGMGDITLAFYSAVVPALSDASPQIVASYSGTLVDTISLPAFNLNKKVNQLLILFSFNRKLEKTQLGRLLAGLRITKDGTDVTEFFEPVFLGDSTSAVLLKSDFVLPRPEPDSSGTTAVAPEGSYTVEMTQPPSITPGLDFRVIPYANDHRLDMEWEVTPAAPRVNQSFTPTVRLSWLGSPVTNAHVEAWFLKPGDDLGDLLARDPLKVDPLNTPDAGSPGHQKYLHLLENDADFLARLKPGEQQLTLVSLGDGRYSATYNPGDVSGVYQILYRVSAEHPVFGKVERLAFQSVYTRFGDIDLDESAVSSTVNDKKVTINIRPMTTYGRFIGPAQGSAFSVDGADISLSSITDHQDGSYTLILAGDPDARVTIKLLGEKIYQGPASKIGKGISQPWWLIWLIILVILLLLIWLFWRRIGAASGP